MGKQKDKALEKLHSIWGLIGHVYDVKLACKVLNATRQQIRYWVHKVRFLISLFVEKNRFKIHFGNLIHMEEEEDINLMKMNFY